jgi:hypothetical protein
MALTTLAGVIAGLQAPIPIQKVSATNLSAGRHGTNWYLGAAPPSATVNASGVNGAALTNPVTGAIPWVSPGSGETVVARSSFRAANTGTAASGAVMLIDRLWHNSGLSNASGLQALSSVAWPARDINQTTDGEGVFIALEMSQAATVNAPTITIEYTNSAGTATRTGVNIAATTATSASSSFYIIGLQTGDTGVRSVQSLTLSVGWTNAIFHLVAFRPIAFFPTQASGTNVVNTLRQIQTEDVVNLGAPRIFDNSVLQLVQLMAGATGAGAMGNLTLASG